MKDMMWTFDIQFFMQKIKWLSIYYENKAMSYKIKLLT